MPSPVIRLPAMYQVRKATFSQVCWETVDFFFIDAVAQPKKSWRHTGGIAACGTLPLVKFQSFGALFAFLSSFFRLHREVLAFVRFYQEQLCQVHQTLCHPRSQKPQKAAHFWPCHPGSIPLCVVVSHCRLMVLGVSFHWIDLILWPLQTCKWSSGHEYCSSFWRKHGMNNDAVQLLHTSSTSQNPPFWEVDTSRFLFVSITCKPSGKHYCPKANVPPIQPCYNTHVPTKKSSHVLSLAQHTPS